MAGISLFNDMVQGIADRGRRLLTTGVRSGGRVEQSAMSVEALCDMLLSSRGEASGIALAAEIFHRWSRMDPGVSRHLFRCSMANSVLTWPSWTRPSAFRQRQRPGCHYSAP